MIKIMVSVQYNSQLYATVVKTNNIREPRAERGLPGLVFSRLCLTSRYVKNDESL